MLLIAPKYRKRGGGLFDILVKTIKEGGKQLASKNTLNTILKSKVTQKLSDAVVKGLASGTEELVKDSLKRTRPTSEKNQKRIKLDINHIVDGGGIVFD